MTYEIVEGASEPSTFQGTYCLTVLVVQNKGLSSPYLPVKILAKLLAS